jgi:hypothetical protein
MKPETKDIIIKTGITVASVIAALMIWENWGKNILTFKKSKDEQI